MAISPGADKQPAPQTLLMAGGGVGRRPGPWRLPRADRGLWQGEGPPREVPSECRPGKSFADNFEGDCTKPLLGKVAVKMRQFNSNPLTQPEVLE